MVQYRDSCSAVVVVVVVVVVIEDRREVISRLPTFLQECSTVLQYLSIIALTVLIFLWFL